MSTRMEFCRECRRHFMTYSAHATCSYCRGSARRREYLAAIRKALSEFEYPKGAVSVVNPPRGLKTAAKVELRKPAMTGLPPRSIYPGD